MKIFRTGIVGSGFIGAAHVEALRRLGYVDVVALADTNSVQEKASKLHISNCFDDYREMIDKCDLDFVHVCSPNNTHKEIALYAIGKGVNVICEKPIAATLEEAEEMADAARRSGLICSVNYHNRFYPLANEMKEIVHSGELGRVFSVHGEYTQDWLLYDTDFSWRLLPSVAGKARCFGDIGSHWVDLAQTVVGERITEVIADMTIVHPIRKRPDNAANTFGSADQEQAYTPFEVETDDICSMMFKFQGGAVGSLFISQVQAGAKNNLKMTVSGSSQAISWGVEDCNTLIIGKRDEPNGMLIKGPGVVHSGTERIISYPGGHGEGFPDAFKQHFNQVYLHAAGAEEKIMGASFDDAVYLMRISNAVVESAKERKWIRV